MTPDVIWGYFFTFMIAVGGGLAGSFLLQRTKSQRNNDDSNSRKTNQETVQILMEQNNKLIEQHAQILGRINGTGNITAQFDEFDMDELIKTGRVSRIGKIEIVISSPADKPQVSA